MVATCIAGGVNGGESCHDTPMGARVAPVFESGRRENRRRRCCRLLAAESPSRTGNSSQTSVSGSAVRWTWRQKTGRHFFYVQRGSHAIGAMEH